MLDMIHLMIHLMIHMVSFLSEKLPILDVLFGAVKGLREKCWSPQASPSSSRANMTHLAGKTRKKIAQTLKHPLLCFAIACCSASTFSGFSGFLRKIILDQRGLQGLRIDHFGQLSFVHLKG